MLHSLLDFKSAVQYMKHFIHCFTSNLHGLIRSHQWPVLNVSGFIAQLVRASQRYREVTGSKSVEVLLYEASLCNCLNCVHNCDDHSLLDFKSEVQYMKHFIYHFTSILHGLIRTHKWPAPNVSGFIAQLVRASQRYREVTGSYFKSDNINYS